MPSTRRLLPPLAVAFGCVAAAAQPDTRAHLGPEETWGDCRLELHDVQGLWGGRDVYVRGDGAAGVQTVSEAREARRVTLTLPPERARALLRLAAEVDVLGAEVPDRPGVPDEARPTLVVVDAAGRRRSIAKWDNDPVPAFDRVRTALLALEQEAAEREPAGADGYDPTWRPWPRVVVTVSLFSGRPDPTFELATAADLADLRRRLRDLPAARPVKAPGLGYRGFRLRAAGAEDVPERLEVYGGAITLTGEAGARTVADREGLEAWLRARAEAAGIELPAR